MPQFILDTGTPDAADRFNRLDEFTRAYIEALFFTESEPGTVADPDGEHDAVAWIPAVHSSLPGDATVADLDESAWESITADCGAFQAANAATLAQAYDRDGYGPESAGHDYWLTRNGHGAGFWDRGLGGVGEELAAAARADGSVDVYRGDDGRVYL